MILDGTAGITFNDASIQNTTAVVTAFKNRIINGAMVIDQRNAGASATPAASTYTVDRFQYQSNLASKFQIGQNLNSVTAPTGFTKYLGFQTAAAVTVAAGDYFALVQPIEGYNMADILSTWNTSTPTTVTLSFWVRSSLTGTFGGTLQGISGSYRSYPFTYTIAAANTWTYITVTVAGDTSAPSSGWITNNGQGLNVWFGLGCGTTYSGTAGSWLSVNYLTATGATSVVGTLGATFYITGIQLEKGSTATSFDYKPFPNELALCQRYYSKSYNHDVVPGTATQVGMEVCGFQGASGLGGAYGNIRFPVKMRTTPGTINIWDGAGTANTHSYTYGGAGSAQTISNGGSWWGSGTPFNTSHSGFYMRPTTTQPSAWNYVHYTADAEL